MTGVAKNRSVTQRCANYIALEAMGRSFDEVHTDMERDRFFKADEAVEYGLIDRVIEHH